MRASINLPAPHAFPCHNFVCEDGYERITTAIIVLIKVGEEGNKLKLSYGCNRGKFCRNRQCIYAIKEEEEEAR